MEKDSEDDVTLNDYKDNSHRFSANSDGIKEDTNES